MVERKAQAERDNGWPVAGRVRILIVDDHPIFRRGLRDLIEEEPDLTVCGEAGDAAEAVQLVRTAQPDVAIVDLSLRGGHGLELIEQIRQRDAAVRILVCSVQAESHFGERALRAGALGYLNKQEAADRLIEALRQILRGEIFVSGPMAKRLLHGIVGGQRSSQDPVAILTNREVQIFQMIGQGLTTKQIARQLRLSHKTVEAHREKIKTKLGLANSVQLSHRAFQWIRDQQ